MNFDIAVAIYLFVLCIIGVWLGLKRQLVQLISLACSIALTYIIKDNLLAAVGAGFHLYGLAARASLLVPLFVAWFVIYWLIRFFVKPFVQAPGRLSGGIFAVLFGMVDIGIIVLACVLAFPTLELRLPRTADILRESVIFKAAQRFDESGFNPLGKWPPAGRIRDVFLAPADPVARDRLENDPNYRDLQSAKRILDLRDDADYQRAVKEGRYRDAARNPKVRALLNDEDAYLALQAFILGRGEKAASVRARKAAAPMKAERPAAPAPVPPSAPGATPPPPAPAPSPSGRGEEPPPSGEKAPKLIILRNGCKMTGIIRSRNEEEVVADIIMNKDVISVTFQNDEIREIRDVW